MKEEREIFKNVVLAELRKSCGEDARIEWMEPRKNNGIQRMAVSIYQERESVGSVCYVDTYFERYCDGELLEKLAKEIRGMCFSQLMKERPQVPDLGDFEVVKDKVFMRLINAEMNQEFLQTAPHIRILDLAFVFGIFLGDYREGSMTAMISSQHVRLWGITQETLYYYATRNTVRLFPASLVSIGDVLVECIGGMAEGDSVDSEKTASKAHVDDVPLWILSNDRQVCGAGAAFYEGELRRAAETVGAERLVIIPSSVHEMLLVPMEDGNPWKRLKKVITEVNETMLQKEEWLSDHAYLYEKESNRLGWIADDGRIQEWADLEQFRIGCRTEVCYD